MTQFQDKGHEDFCQLYYKYWLHRYTKTFFIFCVSFFFTQLCNLFVVVVFNAELAVLLETEMRE